MNAVPDVPHVPVFLEGEGDLGVIFDDLDRLFARFVAFPSDEARWAVVAWVGHCWALDAFDSTPRLAVLSAEKGSGKTRTLEVIELVTPNPKHTVTISAAALFRIVASGSCTILLDEADTYLGWKVAQEHEDLRGLVNAGHRRGAVAYRCDTSGKGVTVQEFPAFAPVVMAGIGDLPDTIIDRSVVVGMKRRAPGETVEPFRERLVRQHGDELRDRLALWGANNTSALESFYPDMPEGVEDRAADVWEPLVILGDVAGEEWSRRIRQAASYLNRVRAQRDPSLGMQLLADCRTVFGSQDRITTDQLIEALVELEESPWGDLRGNPIDSRGLARRLRPYDVRPAKHRFGPTTIRGYLREDFHDAWQRYLTPLPAPGTPEHAEHEEQADIGSWARDYPELFEESA